MSKSWGQVKKYTPTPVSWNYVFKSGKYEGFSVKSVSYLNPDYLVWIHEHSSHIRFDKKVWKVLKKRRRKPSPQILMMFDHVSPHWHDEYDAEYPPDPDYGIFAQ